MSNATRKMVRKIEKTAYANEISHQIPITELGGRNIYNVNICNVAFSLYLLVASCGYVKYRAPPYKQGRSFSFYEEVL